MLGIRRFYCNDNLHIFYSYFSSAVSKNRKGFKNPIEDMLPLSTESRKKVSMAFLACGVFAVVA